MLLGTVPVEADGSAYFRAPARKPLYFQAIDQSGRAVQGMRSVVYLQAGERRGCVGCHEPVGRAPQARPAMASLRPASIIQPGPEGTRPFGWPSPDAVTRPGGLGADASSRSAILTGEKHRKYVKLPDSDLPDDDLRKIYLWLDAHVPFYGTYEEKDLQLQRLGQDVPPPSLQWAERAVWNQGSSRSRMATACPVLSPRRQTTEPDG